MSPGRGAPSAHPPRGAHARRRRPTCGSGRSGGSRRSPRAAGAPTTMLGTDRKPGPARRAPLWRLRPAQTPPHGRRAASRGPRPLRLRPARGPVPWPHSGAPALRPRPLGTPPLEATPTAGPAPRPRAPGVSPPRLAASRPGAAEVRALRAVRSPRPGPAGPVLPPGSARTGPACCGRGCAGCGLGGRRPGHTWPRSCPAALKVKDFKSGLGRPTLVVQWYLFGWHPRALTTWSCPGRAHGNLTLALERGTLGANHVSGALCRESRAQPRECGLRGVWARGSQDACRPLCQERLGAVSCTSRLFLTRPGALVGFLCPLLCCRVGEDVRHRVSALSGESERGSCLCLVFLFLCF